MMTFIENGGGTITLLPRPGLAMNEVTLPLATKKMLVFAADKFSYKYEPKGSTSVSLTSWVLEPPPQMQVKTIDGDAKSKADAVGLYAGREFPTGDRIHVMAVNARLPGGGFGPSEYWSMLMEGTDGEIPIPFLRWDVDIYCSKEWEPHVPGKIYAQHGGFCRHNEIYDFDNKFFDITVEEAEFISPGQRIFMEDGYVVLFRGGHTKESLNGKPVGIFIGDTGSDWTMFTPKTFMVDDGEGGTVEAYGMADNALHGGIQSTTCNRLSHILNLTGPNATADTACSSSLVATGASMLFLRDRRMTPDMKHMEMRRTEGVAGGVCVQIGPGSYIGMCGLNMISPVGRCFTFDESGDGYARGEGVGLMYLKGAEGDELTFNQMACILGCAINQDGRSASMTAPNGPSQQTCITASMREAGNEPRDINLAETHGTGTALGDPIEVGALRNVMEPRETALALTSSKSNIGHLEGGAGVVGLLKCILMLVAGTCPPNAHCRQLNPHLNVAGFPGYFDTEGIDSNLNSALTGVSSFGFGGTNGRCDIWGQAKFGPRKSGKVNIQELDEITVLCPFTLGPINHVTGEPMTKPQGDRKKIRANALRDEWAPYDVSSYAYTGGYRYRQNELADVAEAEELPEDVEPYICGSWSGFTEMELMDKQEDGTYLATMILGETRCETFDICFDKQKDTVAYPAVDMAGQKIWIEGPNELGEGKKWAIDGRDMEVPAGTVYQIRFKFNKEKMEVTWEEASKDSAELALTYEHTYYVCGGFSKHKFTPLEGDEGVWKGSFKIGSQGREEFYFSRDKDLKQLVYPAQSKKGGVPCRGPDNCGAGKYFVVKGRPGEEVTVTLKVADAKVAVSATTESKGTTTWTSQEGWDRHTYTVVGSYNTAPIAMTMDPMKPGVFKCKTSVGFDFVDDFRGFAEVFQVCVDQGSKATFYPEDNLAGPAEMVVFGPNDKGEDKRFLARSLIPGAAFEVVLDLTAEDKRQIVTWTWVADKDAITA
jgi:3-oxoacyl-(acyl-carrier-protein) synthase